jgi:hypothetical protein
VAGFPFREVRKQLIVARFGKLNRAFSTTPHQAEANGLRFRFLHIGGNAGGDVVVRRMDQRIGHKEVMPLAGRRVKKSQIIGDMENSRRFGVKCGCGKNSFFGILGTPQSPLPCTSRSNVLRRARPFSCKVTPMSNL